MQVSITFALGKTIPKMIVNVGWSTKQQMTNHRPRADKPKEKIEGFQID